MKYGLVMLVLNALVYYVYGYLFMCVLGFSVLTTLLSSFVLSVILTPITFKYLYEME